MYYDLLEAFNRGRQDYRYADEPEYIPCPEELSLRFEDEAWLTGVEYEREHGDTAIVEKVWKGRGNTINVQEAEPPHIVVYNVHAEKGVKAFALKVAGKSQ